MVKRLKTKYEIVSIEQTTRLKQWIQLNLAAIGKWQYTLYGKDKCTVNILQLCILFSIYGGKRSPLNHVHRQILKI